MPYISKNNFEGTTYVLGICSIDRWPAFRNCIYDMVMTPDYRDKFAILRMSRHQACDEAIHFTVQSRRMIVFICRFRNSELATELYQRSIGDWAAFSSQLFQSLQRDIKNLHKLPLEDFLDLLIEIISLEKLLEHRLDSVGLEFVDEMAKHLKDYLQNVIKRFEERLRMHDSRIMYYYSLRSLLKKSYLKHRGGYSAMMKTKVR